MVAAASQPLVRPGWQELWSQLFSLYYKENQVTEAQASGMETGVMAVESWNHRGEDKQPQVASESFLAEEVSL